MDFDFRYSQQVIQDRSKQLEKL